MRRTIRGFNEGSGRGHPEIHIVAGCFVSGIDADGRESVERVAVGRSPAFWGHYRVADDGRQLWLADYEDRESAIAAAKRQAGSRPIYLEDPGVLRLRSA